jgi:hypothetical protein
MNTEKLCWLIFPGRSDLVDQIFRTASTETFGAACETISPIQKSGLAEGFD